MAKPAIAQSIPTPSVPQFTVALVDVPGTQEHLIEISINSQQPFAYLYDGTLYHVYFNIRVKQHSEKNWTEFYPVINGTSTWNGGNGGVVPHPDAESYFSYAEYVSSDSPMQSSSDTSANFYAVPMINHIDDVAVFQGYALQRPYSYFDQGEPYNRTFLDQIPVGTQLDFQVQALVGHNSTAWFNISSFWAGIGGYIPAVAYDSASGWSATQTVTLPADSVLPTPTPTVPELSWLMIFPLLFSVLVIAVIVRHRKTALKQ